MTGHGHHNHHGQTHQPKRAHPLAHGRRGIAKKFAQMRGTGKGLVVALLAVLGPGMLAGLSDDDPAGIATYSKLGAEHGYRLLWIIPASTLLLVYFHIVAVQIGVASGKGFVAVIRERWGQSLGYLAVIGLLFANFGTICAEYAGISAAASLVGIPAWFSAPVAGILISLVVVLGSFQRVEGVLLVISSTLALYILDGILAGPDWGLVIHDSVVPQLPLNQAGWLALVATLGTTLAPWGLAFIQSYVVDKKIQIADLAIEKVEVIIGSLLTGVIGMAIAVACAATLYPAGIAVDEAQDVALSLEPLAGKFATLLFGAGLLGASLLAAAVVPLATSYSIAEGIGAPASLHLDSSHFHIFYAVYIGLTVAAVSVVSLPGLPLIPLMYASQVVNAVLLPLHVIALLLLAGNRQIMGQHMAGPKALACGWFFLVLIIVSILALVASWVTQA